LNSDDARNGRAVDAGSDLDAGTEATDVDTDVDTDVGTDVELVVVTMRFDAGEDTSLLAVLSKYVVLTRMEPGCRNVDLVSSVTQPGRHLVIEKWESPSRQRTHFDAPSMVEMATACSGLLARAPDIDLWDATSAHDLR
jgi:quinol monooxygenase YgiN